MNALAAGIVLLAVATSAQLPTTEQQIAVIIMKGRRGPYYRIGHQMRGHWDGATI
jgi:hypothetical protein